MAALNLTHKYHQTVGTFWLQQLIFVNIMFLQYRGIADWIQKIGTTLHMIISFINSTNVDLNV